MVAGSPDRAAVTHRFVNVVSPSAPGEPRGLELAYHVWESEAGEHAPTVVLLHGFLDHGRSFDPVARHLARRFRVVAPDHRGHGESGRVGQGGYYHFPDYVLDLHRLLDHLGVGQVLLAGHSMGASIACYFTGAWPEKILALALLDGIGPPAVPIDRGPALMRRWVNDLKLATERDEPLQAPMATLDEVARRIARTSPGASAERLLELARTASVAVDGGYAFRFDPLHRTTAPMPFDVHRFRAFLQAIRAPTLVIWGERSPMRPPDVEERLTLIADLTRFELPGAAHNLHHERPTELAAVLDGFFARAVTP
jgi:pimeloyl-ACP methyl ester carboxylesterase